MQQSFTKLLTTVDEQNRRFSERENHLVQQNQETRADMDELKDKMNWWFNMFLIGFVIFEIFVVWIIIRICNSFIRWRIKRREKSETIIDNVSLNPKPIICSKRRISLEESKNEKFSNSNRRLSEELLQTYGTYDELLIDCDSDEIRSIGSFDDVVSNKPDRKKNKNRQRKSSIPLHHRAASVERPATKHLKTKVKLFRHESAPNAPPVINNKKSPNGENYSIEITENPVLEENDEIYMPNADIAMNEFMPDGPSYYKNGTTNGASSSTTTSTSTDTKEKGKVKSRRLSSPAFFKAAIARSSLSFKPKSPSHESETGWEWYKINKKSTPSTTSSSSHDNKNNNIKNSKSTNNEISTTSDSGIASLAGRRSISVSPEMTKKLATNERVESVNGKLSAASSKSNHSRKSNSSNNSVDSNSNSSNNSSNFKKSRGNFKKLFKKVF